MSAQPFVPAEVFHPVEVLRDELLARGWDLDTLTTRIVGDHPHVDTTPDAKKRWGVERLGWDVYFACAGRNDGCYLGAKSAAALERTLGIDADFWLRSEDLWRETPPHRRATVPNMEEWLSGS